MNLLQIHEPGQTPLAHQDTLAVGIDLGTTYSAVAVAMSALSHRERGGASLGEGTSFGITGPHPHPLPEGEGVKDGSLPEGEGVKDGSLPEGEGVRAEVIHNIHGHALVPSVVFYGKDGSIEVGYPARLRVEKGQKGAIASVKKLMGRGINDIKTLLGNLPYDVIPGDGMVKLKAGGREVTPVEVSAEILKELKRNAERALGKPVTKAVVTVPAYFDDAARAATKDAARLAGLEVLRLVNEPTAAALAYGLDKSAEGIYAIYDLGGGTFDVSLLKMEKGVFQVLATAGDTALGGDDFDQAIAAWLLAELGHGKKELASEEVGVVVALAREAKHTLTEADEATLQIIFPLRGEEGRGAQVETARTTRPHPSPPPPGEGVILTRETFDNLIAPYVQQSISICEQALLDAKLSTAEVKGVVMVGGSTRVKMVVESVQEFFGKKPLTDVNPDEVVALGAAIQAHGLTQGSDNLLLDVTPLSLGLETMGGLTEKLIYRNTPIPASVSQEFTTYQDGQTGMQIHVVQGEREMVADNRSLARFELKGIPPLPAGIARIKVTFTVDADGLLTVSAEELMTGARQSVDVRPSYGLAPEDMERMLMESMQHAKKDIMERLLAEARVEAERAVIEIESAIKQDGKVLEEGERKAIERQMLVVKNAAEGEDRDYIDAEVHELGRITANFAQRRMDKAIEGALKGKQIDEVTSH